MAEVRTNKVENSFGDRNETPKNIFDIGAFVGDLTFEEDGSSDDISLEGLDLELEECKNYDVVVNILSKGTTLREYTKGVENNLQQVELDSIQVLSAHFRADIQALEKLQLDIATSSDLIGVETRSTSIFSRGRETSKNRSVVYALGDRINILKEIDQPALIPHIAEASYIKYPYEVLFRSLHKLLMDTATSEYLVTLLLDFVF